MSRLGWKILLGLVVLWSAARLSAHNAPGSALLLDFYGDRVGAELRLPLSELEIAFREPLEAAPATVVARFRGRLADYVRQHLALRTPDGRAWTIDVRDMETALAEQPYDLVVRLELRPPAGAPVRRFTLTDDAIAHEVMNHITLVSVRSDWDNALLGDRPELLGALRSFARELVVDRTSGHAWRGFRSVLTLGMRHIAEGTDHLLFLLVLLLPAPLLAAGKRWGGYGGLRHSAMSLGKIVTAFTIGHSLTLMVGALGWLRLAGRPVEVLIAVSILVSAAHALRPMFAGREPLVAVGFGLVHGLAFAGVLAEFHLDAWHLAGALLAFNLGIELMQLAVVIVIAPWFAWLASRGAERPLRVAGAACGGIAALGWMAERVLGRANAISAALDNFPAWWPWLLTAAVGFAAAGLIMVSCRAAPKNL